MKKWLVLFLMADIVFLGLVLKLSTTPQRHVASQDEAFYSELTEGQKNKFDFVKSFEFLANAETITLKTDRLQSLCQSNSRIELKFEAIEVAYAGVHPSVSHIYSCELIRQDLSRSELTTSVQNFLEVHQTHALKLVDSQMTSFKLYADEELPTQWILAEVIVTGEMNFKVSSIEMNKAHADDRFEFTLPATFAK